MNLFEKLFDLENGFIREENLKFLPKKNFVEVFDSNKLTFCINNLSKIKEKYRDDARDKLNVHAYLAKSKDGSIKVKYSQSSNGMFTRYQSCGGLSAGNMVREIRHTIFKKKYTDIDIDNCHPVIIRWICNNMKISYNHLNTYIEDREKVFADLMEINPDKDRAFFKSMILSLNNEGLKAYNGIQPTIFIVQYKREMDEIRDTIVAKLYKFKEKVIIQKPDKKDRINGSTLSNICQFVENQLLMYIVHYLKKKLNQDEFNNIILCFDGLMIPKDSDASVFIDDIQKLFKNMGMDLKMSIKNMDSDLNLDEWDYDSKIKYEVLSQKEAKKNKVIVDDMVIIKEQNINFFNDDDYYWSDFKNDFAAQGIFKEGYLCIAYLVKNLPRVCAFVDDKVVTKKSKDTQYEVKSYEKWAKVVLCQFIHEGELCDPSLQKVISQNFRFFHEFNTISADFSFPRNNREFDISKPYIAKITDDCNLSLVKEFKDLLKELYCSDNEDQLNYFWDWLTFTVKFPHLKTLVGILMISKQGCGKGFLMDFLCRYIYGSYNTVPNMNGIEQLIGEKNKLIMGKKLVCVNELSSTRDTYSSNSNKVKSLITEQDCVIRPLYCDAFSVKQSTEFIMASNHINSMIMEESDRRWNVLAVSETHMNDKKFFSELHAKYYNQDFGDALYTTMMNEKLTAKEWYLKTIPKSDKKDEIKNISKSSVLVFVDELREEHNTGKAFNTAVLWTQYLEWCNTNNEHKTKKTMFKPQLIGYSVKLEKIKGNNFYII